MRIALTIFLCLFLATMARAEKRVALVVGNSDYSHATRLNNPQHDAQDVTEALRDVGFDVIPATDLSIAEFRSKIAEFARKSRDADVSLFYYSGHGMQWEGQNVLVPTDATFESAEIVPFEVLPVDEVMTALSLASSAKILILDACRDNDAERTLKTALAQKRGTRSTALQRGLSRIEATRGQVVVFATQAERTASDSFDTSSRNSPFTHAFLETVRQPGMEIGRTFRRIAARVDELTGGSQLPETSISLLGDFYFVPAQQDNSPVTENVPVVKKPQEQKGKSQSNSFEQWKKNQVIAALPDKPEPKRLARSLNIVSWGGAYTHSQVNAYDKPYAAANPDVVIENLDHSAEAVSRLRAMAKAGRMDWDVVDVISSDAKRLCEEGLAMRINPDRDLAAAPDGTPASRDFGPFLISPCFIPQIAYSMTVGYRHDLLARTPVSVCDLFDINLFPGKRALEKRASSTLVWALMCDGVAPAAVYQTLESDRGIDRALARLDRIRDHIIWWTAGAQTPQMLADGKVVMGSTWNGRLFQVIEEEKKPISMLWDGQILDLDGWIIPKGLPPERQARALHYVRFATGTQRLADQARYIAYGPARNSSIALVGKHHRLGIDMRPHLPTSAENLNNAILVNSDWWAEHGARVNNRFNAWLER